jgi:hypothetical protein
MLRKVVLALGFTILQSLCCCGGRGDSVIDRPIFIGGLKAILYEYASRIHCALPAIVTGCADAAVDLEGCSDDQCHWQRDGRCEQSKPM